MDVQTYVAEQTREVVDWIEHAVGRTPLERHFWHPLDSGRTIHDQVIECAHINTLTANALRARENPVFSAEVRDRLYADHDTMDRALGLLRTSSTLLISAIEGFPNGHLRDEVALPFGGGAKKPFSWLLGMPYWNMTYHLGQINYIQTLYGDKDMI